MAEMYEYVLAIDEDSDPELIDISALLSILRTNQIHIAEPAMTQEYSHIITKQVAQCVVEISCALRIPVSAYNPFSSFL